MLHSHCLIENRFGLFVRTCLTPANAHAERLRHSP